MEQLIQFLPAFDKRDPNPSKNYGIHGVDLMFILKGELGAITFNVFTNWQLPHVTEEFRPKMLPDKYFLFEPKGADISYHSPTPKWEGQTKRDNCPYLDGKPCYNDGSALDAEPIFNILLYSGSDGVWSELKERYINIFGELK
jgi:hypothetical protein